MAALEPKRLSLRPYDRDPRLDLQAMTEDYLTFGHRLEQHIADTATLARIRALIKEAAPDVVEEWMWRGVPVWSASGIICTGETYKSVVKLTFAKGARIADPAGLFNASLEGNVRRAIDLREQDELDEEAFRALVGAAVDLNRSKGR